MRRLSDRRRQMLAKMADRRQCPASMRDGVTSWFCQHYGAHPGRDHLLPAEAEGVVPREGWTWA